MLAGLAFCEMLSQYPQLAFHGVLRGSLGGQQQFVTQTLRVHLLGLDTQLHYSNPWELIREMEWLALPLSVSLSPLTVTFHNCFGVPWN